jgi:hypothetical protein
MCVCGMLARRTTATFRLGVVEKINQKRTKISELTRAPTGTELMTRKKEPSNGSPSEKSKTVRNH